MSKINPQTTVLPESEQTVELGVRVQGKLASWLYEDGTTFEYLSVNVDDAEDLLVQLASHFSIYQPQRRKLAEYLRETTCE